MRAAMRAASQLPGREPTDDDDNDALHVNKKSDYDDDELKIYFSFLNQNKSCVLLKRTVSL